MSIDEKIILPITLTEEEVGVMISKEVSLDIPMQQKIRVPITVEGCHVGTAVSLDLVKQILGDIQASVDINTDTPIEMYVGGQVLLPQNLWINVQDILDINDADGDGPSVPPGQYLELAKETRKDYLLDAIYLYLTTKTQTEYLPPPKTREELLLLYLYKTLVGEAVTIPQTKYLRSVEEILLYNWLCLLCEQPQIGIPYRRLRKEEDFWLYEILDNLGTDTYIPPSYLKDNTSLEVLRYSLISKLL